MKKYVILALVLALSACGGGSGGVSGTLTPEQRAVESNKKITGMLTYMETDASGKTINSRAASTYRSGSVRAGTTGGEFDLGDVKFAMADEGFDTEGFTFHVDSDKKIDGIDMGMSDEEEYPGDEYFKRVGDSNKFTGIIKANGWEDAQLTYESLGKELGLKYADFGNFNVDKYNKKTGKYDISEQRFVFIGGYDDAKKINPDDIAKTTEFYGHATGGVVAVLGGENSGKFLALDADAKLTFDKENATSTLSADFTNWYKVDFVTGVEDKDATYITFSEYGLKDKDGNEDGTFRMVNDPKRNDASEADSFTLKNTIYEDHDDDDNIVMENSLNYDVRYFGDNKKPSEAVTIIQMRDCDGAGCGSDYDKHREVRMNLSFGGKVE